MKILIADDERPARSELKYILESILPEAEFFEADSGLSAKQLIDKENFDICFLDIEMGEPKGTEVASYAARKNPLTHIVFVTAYGNYALEAFDLDATDYVMKPFDENRIKKSLEKLKNRGAFEKESLKPIALSAGDRIDLVDPMEIIYIEAVHKGSYVHTKISTYFEGEPLSEWEKKLPMKNDAFRRIHKSYIVNMMKAEAFVPDYNKGYAIKLKDVEGEPIPISRMVIKEIREYFKA